MIFDSTIASVQKNATDAAKMITPDRKAKTNKRKRKTDRRSSVRDGVIVNLSFKSDRRKGVDRQKLQM